MSYAKAMITCFMSYAKAADFMLHELRKTNCQQKVKDFLVKGRVPK